MNISAAVVQLMSDTSILKNLEKISMYCEKASLSGCKMIVFPELIDFGYHLYLYDSIYTSPWLCYSKELSEISNSNDIIILFGGCEVDEGDKYNSLFIVEPNQQVRSIYRKRVLFGDETKHFIPGITAGSFVYKNILIGVNICFDLRFPELFFHTQEAPKIQVVSSAWPLSRISQWKRLLIARAIENQCYILASNRVGSDDLIIFGGNSLIINPYGDIISEASTTEEMLITGKLVIDIVDQFRDAIPVHKQRKCLHE